MSKPTQLDLTLPEKWSPPAGSSTGGDERFMKPQAHPCGMVEPFYVASMYHEYPGYTTLTLHACDGGEALTIGDCGIFVYKSLADLANGVCPLRSLAPCEKTPLLNWPLDGWQVVARWCDQTGGMTMVDQFVFKNGCHLSLTSECVIMWHNSDQYFNDDDDGSAFGYVDIAEGM